MFCDIREDQKKNTRNSDRQDFCKIFISFSFSGFKRDSVRHSHPLILEIDDIRNNEKKVLFIWYFTPKKSISPPSSREYGKRIEISADFVNNFE